MRFLYVMDPMCSWCYGFQPELEAFLAVHDSADVSWGMGGLAPDSSQPMADELRQKIASYWYEIENKTQVSFNHDYWQLNTPYRSTYIACRAVIAAECLMENSAELMVKAIQSAYYQQAKNPSLQQTLMDCGSSIGLDEKQFLDVLVSEENERRFQQDLAVARQLQVSAFPTLFFIDEANQAIPLTLGFRKTEELVQRFDEIQNKKR